MASKNSFDCSLVSPLTQSARKIETTISLSPRAITMWLIILIILEEESWFTQYSEPDWDWLLKKDGDGGGEERWAASLLSTTGSDCYWSKMILLLLPPAGGQLVPPPPLSRLSHHGPDCWQWSWSVTMQYIMQGSQFKCYSLSHFFVW